MKLHVNVLKFSYFFYRIIDRITEFSFIIFLDFIHLMKYFILSIMDYHLFFFSLLPIIYYILLFVCQSLTINLCDTRVNNLVTNLKVLGEFQSFFHLSTSFFPNPQLPLQSVHRFSPVATPSMVFALSN